GDVNSVNEVNAVITTAAGKFVLPLPWGLGSRAGMDACARVMEFATVCFSGSDVLDLPPSER
ncbi:MAG: hypothetical protein RLZZ245_2670, partial [Verrucomicrobiota bacterium]